jgi:ferredoxin-NADP reductase
MIDLKIELATFRVKEVRQLTSETFVLRTDKNHIQFTPGQWLNINLRNDSIKRKYSIYSGKDEPHLEFLIREVPEGYLTPKLKPIRPGNELEIFGPKGKFALTTIDHENDKLLFVSTGTGIAPFHSMIKSHPTLNYKLVHGVRVSREAYHREDYDPQRLTVCTSQEKGADFHGRVTHYLENANLAGFDHIFICGNRQMIGDVTGIALSKGLLPEKIHTEVYF